MVETVHSFLMNLSSNFCKANKVNKTHRFPPMVKSINETEYDIFVVREREKEIDPLILGMSSIYKFI
jgi:hypothetical protein